MQLAMQRRLQKEQEKEADKKKRSSVEGKQLLKAAAAALALNTEMPERRIRKSERCVATVRSRRRKEL